MDSDNHIGWLLLLKKRRLSLQRNDTQADTFQYLLFGNFDTLQVKPIMDWNDQLPDYQLDLDASGIPTDLAEDYSFQQIPYASNYVLRALKPGSTDCLQYPDYEVPSYDKPFFAMVLVNYSHSICRAFVSGRELTEWMVRQLVECPVVQSGDVECGIYECLGFYDAVVMLRSGSPGYLQSFCTYVRNLRYSEPSEPHYSSYAVSSCYAVLGLQNRDMISQEFLPKFNQAMENAQADIEQVRIHLQLQPGILNTSHQEMFPSNSTFSQALNGYKDVTVTVPNEQSAELFGRYFSNGSLNPGMRSETVLHADTQVYTNENITPGEAGPNPEIDNEVFPFDGGFWNTYQDYVSHRKNAKRSLRLATALRQTILRYQNLVVSDHCFDLKKLVNPVFRALYLNMKRANAYLDMLAERLRAAGSPQESDHIHAELQSFWEKYDLVLKCFRDLVGRYISDLSLSDTHFIEDSHLKYPSIGTATKYIFTYQVLTQMLADCVPQGQPKYQFLVKSGGQDEVYITNIFNDLWRDIPDFGLPPEPSCELLVIDVPERILYDLPTTVFALAHEVFHYVGNRSRNIRAEYLADAIAGHTAHFLVEIYFNIYFRFELQHYIITRFLSQDESNRIFDVGKQIYQKSIYDQMRKKLRDELSGLSEKQLLSAHLNTYMTETCTALLFGSFQDTIVREAYQSLLSAISEQIATISDATKPGAPRYPSRYILVERVIHDELLSVNSLQPVWQDYAPTSDLVDTCVSALLGLTVDIPDEFIPKEHKEQFIALLHQDIPNACDSYVEAMCEGFSDIMAIETLQLSWEDYIVYLFSSRPEGTVYGILSLTEQTVLRLGCVLFCKFSIENALTVEQKKTLTERLKAGQFKEPDKLVERLVSVLKICWSSYGSNGNDIMKFICEYLKNATSTLSAGMEEAFRQASEELRRFAKSADAQAKKEQIMQYWLQLAKE